MSATDELRRMLDEAGVEWDYGITGAASTMFNANGVELTFIDMRDGVTCSTILTPAQAIAATVGNAALEAENAKLRELVRDMYKAFQRVFPDGHRLDFEMDMRELGVEVSDGD